MTRRVLSGTLIVLSAILLVLSIVGIGSVWYHNEPLTSRIIAKGIAVDDELSQAQNALENAQEELKRALRIVEASDESLQSLNQQATVAKELLDTVTEVLDETITPSLETSKEKIDEAQKTLNDLRTSIETLNKIPFVNLDLPDDEILIFFVETIDSLENEVSRVDDIADQASIFMNDTSSHMTV